MNINVNKIPSFNGYVVLDEKVIANAGDEILIPFTDSDQKLLILVTNTVGAEDAEIIFEKGEMLQSTDDLEIMVAEGKTIAVSLESGKFKKKDGNVKATVTESLEIQLIALP